jgi:thiol-disulfide isomerase/thioredoxin
LLTWAALAVFAFAGIVILYVVFAAASKPAPTHGMSRFAVGAMHRLVVMENPPAMPMRAIRDAQGGVTNLRSFSGQVLVVNLWATWCAPCMEEMPTLGALQRRFAGRIRVIPISADGEADRGKAERELAHLSGGALPFYIDETRGMLFDEEAAGMPVTIIYDRSGHELARLTGGADWSSDAAATVIQAAIEAG